MKPLLLRITLLIFVVIVVDQNDGLCVRNVAEQILATTNGDGVVETFVTQLLITRWNR
jgi:hypothetical protein